MIELGIAVTIITLFTLLFLLIGGAFADRLSRRWLILGNDGVGAIVTAILAFLGWSGTLEVWHIYAAAAALGAAYAFLFPAYGAIITELLPADLLKEGNAARSLGGALARTIGPAAAGVVVAVWGPAAAFGVDALTFLFSFLLFLLARATAPPSADGTGLLRQVREGVSLVAGKPWLWMAILAYGVINITYGGQRGVMVPLFVQDVLHAGAATFGLVMAVHGAGQIIGGLLVAQLPVRRPGVGMYACEIVAGISTFAVGLLPSLPATLLMMAIMGIALSSSDTLFNLTVQRNVPAGLLGRVTSINLLVGGVLVPISPLAAALLMGAVGPAQTFVIAGAFAAGIALLLLFAAPTRSLR